MTMSDMVAGALSAVPFRMKGPEPILVERYYDEAFRVIQTRRTADSHAA